MKNKEKYAKEIIELACNGSNIAVNKVTGKPVKCSECDCNQCMFCEDGNCEDSDFGLLSEWAESEYIKKPVISKRDRVFLEYIKNSAKWMTRDCDGKLWLWETIPKKSVIQEVWTCAAGNGLNVFNIDFPMVKWEDDEPWLIEDLKKLEVVEEYE